ncbi:hypothetical protein FRC02_003974 [Tulasnella sp. 418]|nr:hypothetical protein FRC02_003974 [Tulasnella sp. 418]
MPPPTNAGQIAVSPTTTAESERASSLSSWNVIQHLDGVGGTAMAASGYHHL